MHTPAVCSHWVRWWSQTELFDSLWFINVSFLKRRTQVSIPCSIQFSSASASSPRHRGDIHIKCNTENISIFFTRFNVNNINV